MRGLKLESDKNEELRPTKDRIKKSLFDILGFDIYNKIFLDLFGGTGQIGIEALSREAKEVIIVEINPKNIKLIKKNLSRIKLIHQTKLYEGNAIDFLKNNKLKIDIAFIDPPYGDSDLLLKTLELTPSIMNENGIIVTETLSSQNIQNTVKDFSLQKRYNYGKISLNLYKKQ